MRVIPPSARGITGHQSCPVWGSPDDLAVVTVVDEADVVVLLPVEVVTVEVVVVVVVTL